MITNKVKVLGIIFLVIGVLGFIPALAPQGMLLGIFEVDTVHNVVHLLSGILALVFAARGTHMAQAFSKVFGIVYGLVAIIGLMSPTVLGLFAVNGADNILHILLAIIFLVLGFKKSHQKMAMPMQDHTTM
ncbi:DUF4383 domain-containing protein [Patescibacteria group bacterium]|nr:DUF4383 domain-containing protein [Patescibacteria group bacterium]